MGVGLNDSREPAKHRDGTTPRDWLKGLRSLLTRRKNRRQAIARHRAEIEALEATYDGLRDGSLDWRTWNDELTCGERQQVAIEECFSELRSCREALAALRGELAWH